MAINKTHRFNYIFILCFVLFTFSFMFFFTPDASAATQVTLEWSPNSEPDLAGYQVIAREEGQTYDYASPSWEGTEPTAIIYNIDETKTNYFVARAFDTEGFESADSNEVSLEPATTLNQPPVADAGGLQSSADCLVYVAPETTAPPVPTNNPPVADYSYVESRLKVTFTDGSTDSDGTIVSWVWNFGDGTTSTVQNPRHRYSRNGTYTITLTVTDDGGAADSTSKAVTATK